MKREQCLAIFLLAGIPVSSVDELPNDYWPDVLDYYEIRKNSPWWLVHTQLGMITIGWRKRVISINWERTGIQCKVTTDQVTGDYTMVHAYSYAKAVEYLATLAKHQVRAYVESAAEKENGRG